VALYALLEGGTESKVAIESKNSPFPYKELEDCIEDNEIEEENPINEGLVTLQ